MTKRRLGVRGPEVSPLGFGCMRLPTRDGRIDRPAAATMLRTALDRGVNYVDTAWPYHDGESETFLAEVLESGSYGHVLVADKLPTWLVESPADLDRFFDEQRRRLKRDRIDVYLLHALDAKRWPAMQAVGADEWLHRRKEAGDIGWAGFSFHDDYPAFESIVAGWDWDICQIQYNYMDVEEQAGTRGLELAAGKGIGTVVMEPLLGGNLANPPAPVEAVWRRSAEPRWSAAERALRWLWNRRDVDLVLSGMSRLDQVEENLRVAEAAEPEGLNAAEAALYDEVRSVYRSLKAIGCTGCGYCMPCPQGVDIPWNFRTFNTFAMYGNADWSRGQYRWMRASYEKGLSETDPRAEMCISCGECEPKCPQKLTIGRLMPQVAEVLGGTKEPAEIRL